MTPPAKVPPSPEAQAWRAAQAAAHAATEHKRIAEAAVLVHARTRLLNDDPGGHAMRYLASVLLAADAARAEAVREVQRTHEATLTAIQKRTAAKAAARAQDTPPGPDLALLAGRPHR